MQKRHTSPGGPPPTLAEIVVRAYERYPERPLPDARQEYAAALSRQADSVLAGHPALSGRYQTDELGTAAGLQEWEVGLEMPLWRPGQRDARQRLSAATAESADAASGALKLEVAGLVRDALWAVFLARNNLSQAEREWQTAQALERDVSKRVELGEMAKTDLLLAQDETLTRQDRLWIMRTEAAHALERYQALTGSERLPRRKAETRSPLDRIPEDHPSLAYLRAELRRAQSNAHLTRHERAAAPDLLLGARREKDAAGVDAVDSVGLSLRWPIATRTHGAPLVRAAQLEVTQAESDLAAAHRSLSVDLHEARHEIRTTEQRLEAAQRKVALARENLRLAQLAFSLGETDLVSLLRVQSLSFAAERAQRELALQRQRAIARYNQVVGVTP